MPHHAPLLFFAQLLMWRGDLTGVELTPQQGWQCESNGSSELIQFNDSSYFFWLITTTLEIRYKTPFCRRRKLSYIQFVLICDTPLPKVVNLCSGKPGLPVKIVLPLVPVKKTFTGKKIWREKRSFSPIFVWNCMETRHFNSKWIFFTLKSCSKASCTLKNKYYCLQHILTL